MIFDAFVRPDGIAVAYGDTEIEGLTVADARKLAARIVMACDRADAAERARVTNERRQAAADLFRQMWPDTFDSPSATLGPLVVADVRGDRPHVHIVNEMRSCHIDHSEVLTVPPTWLVEYAGRKAHLWRGGSKTACGEHKRYTRTTISHDTADRCPKCAALEAK